MTKNSFRTILALTASSFALMSAAGAYAANGDTEAGAEGADAKAIIVTAERSKAAETAPSKAILTETQPEAVVTHQFIEQAIPESGGWVEVTSIAPSMAGITANGGGVGETTKTTLRGFQDGQFNLTYDGIAFGDTNGPTHHEASYWPVSTIGSAVIDRGPGAAGDLGPANFGGAIHLFSPDVSDKFGGSQKLTYGSFNTREAVTQLNTGAISQLGGAKMFVSLEELASDGELSYSSGVSQNQLVKIVAPIGPNWQFTLFGSHLYTKFYQNDGTGAGETLQQVAAYGKNFALTNIPGDEHYYKDNYQAKQTDFEYADIKGEIIPSLTAEDQFYTYYYKNSTLSATSNQDLVGIGNPNSLVTLIPAYTIPGQHSTDLQGYDKLNQYRVLGDIVRLNKDFSFGTLKVGGVYEWSTTNRHNRFLDLTDGQTPDIVFGPLAAAKNVTAFPTNASLEENSDFQDYQLFADFYFRPTDKLTITPGFKYVQEHLDVRAADEKKVGGANNGPPSYTALANTPLYDSRDAGSPLYFLTVNYKIKPYWTAYAQYATSFLFPDITSLYFTNAGLGGLQPQRTKSYQTGTVYSRGKFTADADIYAVDATNLIQTCIVGLQQYDCNAGRAHYAGVEGEAAYAFDMGVTLFANGGSNSSKQLATAKNPAAGIQNNINPGELLNSPRWTAALGLVYKHGPWQGTATYKQVGAFASSATQTLQGTIPVNGYTVPIMEPGYDTIDLSGAYDFGHAKVKLQVSNLLDKRAITSLKGSNYQSPSGYNASYVEFQAGREIEVTLQAKF